VGNKLEIIVIHPLQCNTMRYRNKWYVQFGVFKKKKTIRYCIFASCRDEMLFKTSFIIELLYFWRL